MATKDIDAIKQELAQDVQSLIPIQNDILQLQQSPEVVKYLEKVNQFKNKEAAIREVIQGQMEKHGIKSIKGENWGSMTIRENTNFSAEDLDSVPPKFIKKALDTTKLRAHLKLSDKLPKGVEVTHTRSLVIKLKSPTEES
ncbi:MAG: siphovirus Gp157 family protein [Flavobacteriales bacterium]|nr:siphovirus Gp157 family protein [Flavobacteriales bacterium]